MKRLLILITLTLSIPYIQNLMIYIGIFELYSTDWIKAQLMNILSFFLIPAPQLMLIMVAEIFWPFVFTVLVMKGCQFFKKNQLIHPAALAAGFWLILNGSSILIS
jgi:hypothetical protein